MLRGNEPQNRIIELPVYGYDGYADIALCGPLPSTLGNCRCVKLAQNASIAVPGAPITIIGGPTYYQFFQSVTRGVVRDNSSQDDSPVMTSVMYDAHSNGGNSGGACIVNDSVVAIVAWGLGTSYSSINGGVSADIAFRIIEDLIAFGGEQRERSGYLPLTYMAMDMPTMLSIEGYPWDTVQLQGVRVTSSSVDGVNVDDVILSVDDVSVGALDGQRTMFELLHNRTPGDIVSLTVRRGSTIFTVNPTLIAVPAINDWPLDYGVNRESNKIFLKSKSLKND